jgi:hypothetical protein
METPAPVDLVPTEMPQVMPEANQPSQPYTPPTPATAPPITNTAKEMAKHGQPVTQETYIKQTIQPGVGHASTVSPSMVQAPGVVGRGAKDSIQFLAQLYMDGNQEYQVYVDRMGPARHPMDGSVLPCGQLHILPPMPYMDIYERVRQLNGGGKYSMRIVDPVGNTRHTIQFSIDVVANPPINNIPNGGAGYRPVGMPPNSTTDAFSPASQTSDIYKIREAEQAARAQKSLIVAEFEVEDTKRTINKRRQAEIEAEERKTMAPFEQQAKIETQRAVDDLKNLIRETQHQNDRRMDQIQQNFEKTILAISANKPNDNNSMITLMTTMMKGQSDMLIAVLGSKNGNNENLETMKMISASNEKVTQMALQSARDATSKSDSLLQTLITNRLEHPENAVKQALDMRESGWKQATEMFERLERMRDNGNDEEVINPEGGFWSNLGNVILSQLQKLTAGGMKGGASMALNALAAMMGKPAGTTQYSDAELKQATDMLMRQEAARRGIIVPPAAQPAPALPSPTQPVTFQQPPARQPIRFDPRKIFDRVYETETVQTATPPAQVFQQTVPPAPVPVSPVEEVEEVQPAAPTVVEQQPPAPVVPVDEEVEEEETSSLSDYVNQAIAVALDDLKSGRKSHDWIDIALDKWDESFLQALAQAPQPSEYDISAHIGLIQQKADPALFAELYNALVNNPKSGEWYPKFLENFQEFLASIKEGTPA